MKLIGVNVSESVARRGFEPLIWSLRTICPGPLDERAIKYDYTKLAGLTQKFTSVTLKYYEPFILEVKETKCSG